MLSCLSSCLISSIHWAMYLTWKRKLYSKSVIRKKNSKKRGLLHFPCCFECLSQGQPDFCPWSSLDCPWVCWEPWFLIGLVIGQMLQVVKEDRWWFNKNRWRKSSCRIDNSRKVAVWHSYKKDYKIWTKICYFSPLLGQLWGRGEENNNRVTYRLSHTCTQHSQHNLVPLGKLRKWREDDKYLPESLTWGWVCGTWLSGSSDRHVKLARKDI